MDAKKLKNIGRYTIIKSLGRGGMGEVFLATDPVCQREVALKCIREDLKEKKNIKERFLKEAKIASQLAHPSIIPIYTIHQDHENSFYTMPYIEGETLRQILRNTKESLKKGEASHPIGGSIPSLLRLFLHVCEAVGYAHSKEILHRDLKPENIIIGKYGEVLILDWGIADHIVNQTAKTGKAAGTVSYMAPERAFGKPSSILTEVYALGVILYQILTLELPFERGNFAAFKKVVQKEKLTDPLLVAPYREIPHEAATIVKRCLAVQESERYPSVDALIIDIKKLIEGKPEWVLLSSLRIEKKEDWEFQENILLAKHTAITRHVDLLEWVNLMVSKQIFPDNVRIEAEVKIRKGGNGIGFLFSIPESPKKKTIEEGYCLWIGSKKNPSCQLYRSNLLVAEDKNNYLEDDTFHQITIEKFKEHVQVQIDNLGVLSYYSKFPLSGSHVGILSKDADFEIRNVKVYGSSHSASVSCLAVPDAFFARGDFDTAITEYRRIAKSFPGREEGREAIFRSGLCMIEKSKHAKGKQHNILEQALQEFELLHYTSGAPLEYLGKSIVYDLLNDAEEEVKCLEFALRKYPKHPLLPLLEEHIIYRMHASSRSRRKTAYQMILLAICYFPKIFKSNDAKKLLESLQKSWEIPYFFEKHPESHKISSPIQMAILLAFWVRKLSLLIEMPKNLCKTKSVDLISLGNIAFSLLELDFHEELSKYLHEYREFLPHGDLFHTAMKLDVKKQVQTLSDKSSLTKNEERAYLYSFRALLQKEDLLPAIKLQEALLPLQVEDKTNLDELMTWLALFEDKLEKAEKYLSSYKVEDLSQDKHPLFFVYGAFLAKKDSSEKAMEHFSHIEETSYPSTTASPAFYLLDKIDEHSQWIHQAFYWEKKILFQKLFFYYRAIGNRQKEEYFRSFL